MPNSFQNERAAFLSNCLPHLIFRKRQAACLRVPLKCSTPSPAASPRISLDLVRRVCGAAAAVILTSTYLLPAHAVVSAPLCIKGEGPGCEQAAAESPLIRELLEKSKVNKEKNDREVLEKYWAQGYGDYFSFGYNKTLKKAEDGKWILTDPDDLIAATGRRILGLAGKKAPEQVSK